MLAGETVTATTPVPFKLTVWGLFVPVSVTVSVPAREPSDAGVNVTAMVQVLLTPRVAGLTGQLFVWV